MNRDRIQVLITLTFLTIGGLAIIYSTAILHQPNPVGQYPHIQWATFGVFLAFLGMGLDWYRLNRKEEKRQSYEN